MDDMDFNRYRNNVGNTQHDLMGKYISRTVISFQ